MTIDAVQQAYQAQLQQFYGDQSLADETERLLLTGAGPFANHVMPSLKQPENREGMPAAMLAAYDYYAEQIAAQDLGRVDGVTLLVGEQITFGVAVTTDGEDGWIEVYDIEGQLLGAARTYLDQVQWGEREQMRSLVETSALPPELEARLSALGL
ncbi:MAG: hypothetical protein HC824_08740 [Synechococcales cyanobacterium RM1_1_8]|nr:hypothetical protein [Synechococcales cyanobacterium RM1_1_8]